MMNHLLSSAYQREDWISFLQTRFLPNDFKLKKQAINIEFKSKYIRPQAYWIGDCDSLNNLAIIEISHGSENDPRIGVSRDAFRLMAELNLENALFFFVSENSNNYRFSLITLKLELEGTDVKYKFSNPKRFSFYLGENAKTKTPELFLFQKGRISDLEDLQGRFSIEVVNKEFYQRIQKSFYSLVGGKLKQGNKEEEFQSQLMLPGNPDTKTRQEFGVRLIGRIVFCWFLKKKLSDKGNPLIPDDVLSSAAVKNSFYHHVLEPLFFEVLNRPSEERNPDLRKAPFESIPYLNGGLFDPSMHQDYYSPSNSQRAALPAWDLKIPDDWFRELFAILETYNFTIDENTPIDIDLCVDPEMLGRIFENLLAEINPETGQSAKNATGSFYTPRPIVEYMVDEALIQYLKSKTDIDEDALRDLLDYNIEETGFDKAQNLAVLDALDEIKVLDPACGSGAFPIGILQKMLLILQKVDPESIEWVVRQLDKIPNKLVRDALEEKLMDENWQYQHKMGIIQNAIYGVDIQPIATEISKLRLFLSLIVDESVIEAKDNKNIHPLPNLSFKFVTANSLIPLGEKKETQLLYKKYIRKYDGIRDRYFHAHFVKEKESIKSEFAALQKELVAKYFEPTFSQADILGEPEEKPLTIKKEKEYIFKLVEWNPFEDKVSAWFDPKWMLGVKDGFDIVIGNPPYIQLQKAFDDKRKFADLYKDCKYQSFERSGDMYCLFYERGVQLLSPGGVLCYITSNKWMRANYGGALRKYLAENTQARILIDFGGFKVFDSATVDTNILLTQNSAPGKPDGRACSIKADFHKGNSITKYVAEHGIPLPAFSAESWIIADDSAQQLKAKIERIGTPLKDWDISIYRGILTGYNEAFIISGAKKDELIAADPRSAEIIKPILRGRDIKRYKADFADKWLLFIPWHFPLHKDTNISGASLEAEEEFAKQYPAIYRHLLSYKEQLSRRNKAETGIRYEWYALQRCAATYYTEFEKEKVVWQEMVQKPTFSYDYTRTYFCLDTGRILTGVNLKYLACILNSRLFFYIVKEFYGGGALGGTGIRMKHTFLNYAPIPKVNNGFNQLFCELSYTIISRIESGLSTQSTESQIDLMVYKLYELTYSEAKLIDPDLDSVLASFGLSAQDFERMSIEDLSKLEVK